MATSQISYLNFLVEKTIFFGTKIVSAFGIVSNFLNILICLRKELRNGILGYYNFLMSIFNILTFVTILFFYFPITIGLKSVANLSDISCAILTYSTRVLIQMSIWINVGVNPPRGKSF